MNTFLAKATPLLATALILAAATLSPPSQAAQAKPGDGARIVANDDPTCSPDDGDFICGDTVTIGQGTL